MTRQIRHIRRSKYGKHFIAGSNNRIIKIIKEGKKLITRAHDGWIVENKIVNVIRGGEYSVNIIDEEYGSPEDAWGSVHFHPNQSLNEFFGNYIIPSKEDINLWKKLRKFKIKKHFIFGEDGVYLWDNGKERWFNLYGEEIK